MEAVLVGGLFDKVLKRKEEVVCRDIAGETFLVPVFGELADLRGIFTMNATAGDIWRMLDGRRPLREIRDEVLREYDVDEGQVDGDIAEFVGGLIKEGLVVEVG
jgi:hypothetical protein